VNIDKLARRAPADGRQPPEDGETTALSAAAGMPAGSDPGSSDGSWVDNAAYCPARGSDSADSPTRTTSDLYNRDAVGNWASINIARPR
jgi:hypothetical protein